MYEKSSIHDSFRGVYFVVLCRHEALHYSFGGVVNTVLVLRNSVTKDFTNGQVNVVYPFYTIYLSLTAPCQTTTDTVLLPRKIYYYDNRAPILLWPDLCCLCRQRTTSLSTLLYLFYLYLIDVKQKILNLSLPFLRHLPVTRTFDLNLATWLS